MPIGAIIAGGASLLGGLFSSNAATDAAKIQAGATNQASAIQGLEYTDIANKLLPFLELGTTGANVLSNNFFGVSPTGTFNPDAPFQKPISSVVGGPPGIPNFAPPPSPNDPSLRTSFQASPGYQYTLGQTGNAIQNSAAGRTGAVSGNMFRALQGNASGLANQDFANYYQRLFDTWNNTAQNQQQTYQNQTTNYNNSYNDIAGNRNQIIALLSNLMSSGQGAAAQQGQFGQQAVNNIGNNLNLGASARAAGTIGSANAFTNAFNNPNVQNLFNTQNPNSALNYLIGGAGFAPGSGAGSGIYTNLSNGVTSDVAGGALNLFSGNY